MYRSIGARSYLDSILKKEPERPKPVPRGGKKKKKKAKKPKRSEIERLKERYGKDFILSLLLMILKGKTPGEKKPKKEKKGRKMKRAKGGEFMSKKALARQRETARKAAMIEKARQPQPGDTPESIKKRVLETTLSQNDPTGQLGLIYQLTGGFNLKQTNYKGKDLRGSVAYIGRLVKELRNIYSVDTTQQPPEVLAKIELQRRGLEQEALRTIYQFRGEEFDKIYAPTGRGKRSKVVTEGLKSSEEFITKLYKEIGESDDLEAIQEILKSKDWGDLVTGATVPEDRDPVDLFSKPPAVPVAETDVETDVPTAPRASPIPTGSSPKGPAFVKEGDKKSGRSKGKTFTEEKKKPAPGSAPTLQELRSIPVEERYKQGKLTRKEFAEVLSNNDKLEYLERISAEAPDGLRRSDGLFKGWLDDDGFPIPPKDIYDDFYLKYHPDVSDVLPPQARIPDDFYRNWKKERYRINGLIGPPYYKAIEEYLAKVLSFGFNSVEEIPDEYVTGFTLPSGVRGQPRKPARPDFIKSFGQEQREPEPQTEQTTFDPQPPPAPAQPPFPTIEARDTDEGTSSESDVPAPPPGKSPPDPETSGIDTETAEFLKGIETATDVEKTKGRRGRKSKDKQKEIDDKTKEYTEKVNKLNLNIITQFGLDVDKEKDEILQRLVANINQETSSNQRGKLNKQLRKLTDRLLTGKSNIGFGVAEQAGLGTKRKPKLSAKTRLQKVKDEDGNVIMGSYKDTETGEVFNLKDFYPEYAEYSAELQSGKRGSKKYKKLLKQLDDDFLWSLNDNIKEVDDIGKKGFTDDLSVSSIADAEKKFGFKLSPFYTEPTDARRIQGEIIGAGPKGITVRNDRGYLRFVEFSKETIPKEETPSVPAPAPETTFVPDVSSNPLFTPEGDYIGPTGLTDTETTPFGGQYAFSSSGDDFFYEGPLPGELTELEQQRVAKQRQKKLKSTEQRKAAEERRQRRIKKELEQKRLQEFKEGLEKERLVKPPPTPGASQTIKLPSKPKVEQQQFSDTDSGKEQEFILGGEELKGKKVTSVDKTKLKELEKDLEEKKEVVKKRGKKSTRKQLASVAVAEKRLEKEKEKLAKLEKQIQETTAQSLQRYNIEDTYGIYSETESSDTGAGKRIPVRNQAELDERVKRKIAKGDFKQQTATKIVGYTETGEVNKKGHKLRKPILEKVNIGPSVEEQAEKYKADFYLDAFSQEMENQKRQAAGQRLVPGPILTPSQVARKELKQQQKAYKEQMKKLYEGGENYAGKLVADLEQAGNVPIAGVKSTGVVAEQRARRAKDPSLTAADRISANIRDLRTREEKELAQKIYSSFADKLLTPEKRNYTQEEENTIQTEIDLATKQLRKSEAERKKVLKKGETEEQKSLNQFNKEFKGLYNINKDAYFKRREDVLKQSQQEDADVELDGGSATAEDKPKPKPKSKPKYLFEGLGKPKKRDPDAPKTVIPGPELEIDETVYDTDEEGDLTDTSIQTALDAANIVGDADLEI